MVNESASQKHYLLIIECSFGRKFSKRFSFLGKSGHSFPGQFLSCFTSQGVLLSFKTANNLWLIKVHRHATLAAQFCH